MPKEGLEPSRHYWQRILSPQRLPFRHSGIYKVKYLIFYQAKIEKILGTSLYLNKNYEFLIDSVLKIKFEQKLAFLNLLWFISL